MAVITYKPSSTKAELLEIAAANGVAVNDGMTKAEIIAALDAHNAAEQPETPGPTDNTAEGENAAQSGTDGTQDKPDSDTDSGGDDEAPQGAQDGAGQPGTPGTTDDTTEDENAAQSGTEDEYNMFVYAGPTLPRGRLKENAVFRGTFKDVSAYLADVLEDYPQAAKLIVPAHKLGAFAVKVKTPGNIAYKHYTDIVSAMRGNKEV